MTTPPEAAFRVAILDALSKRIGKALAEARQDAEPLFAKHRAAGNKQVEVTLPNGTPVGTVTIKAGEDVVRFRESDLLAWVMANAPTEIETTVSPHALDRPDVVAYIRRFYPELVTKQVREAYRTKLLGQLNDDGELVVEATGEVVKLADVSRSDPSGAFVLNWESAKKGKPAGRDRIAEAWASGELSLAEILRPAIEAGGDQ